MSHRVSNSVKPQAGKKDQGAEFRKDGQCRSRSQDSGPRIGWFFQKVDVGKESGRQK